jgi:2-C-methyl-D-erythritol 4-phosphate cytidylyltransferase
VVLVHDAARPLVTADEVRALLAVLPGHDGAILASSPVDTLWSSEKDRVREVVDRRGMVRAFTPQAFPFAALKDAIERGISEGFEGTDDASFVRRLGGEVAWVQGSRWNIKVTYPEDLTLVEAILGGGGCA